MKIRLFLVFFSVFFTFSASANHGIEAIGDGIVELAFIVIFGVIGTILFILFAALRFGLRRYLFSIGTYIVAAALLLYRASQYFTIRAEFSGYNSMYYTPSFMEEKMSSSAIWFFGTLAVVILYLVFDIYAIRLERNKKPAASQ